jgi:hypothetical protein
MDSQAKQEKREESLKIGCDYPDCHLCDEPFCILDVSVKKDPVLIASRLLSSKIEG